MEALTAFSGESVGEMRTSGSRGKLFYRLSNRPFKSILLKEMISGEDAPIPSNTTYRGYGSQPDTPITAIGSKGYIIERDTNPVPLPGAVWLLGSGLLGLAGWRRLKKS